LTNVLSIKNLVETEHKKLLTVLLVLAAVYFPFADKAFHLDDTLFLKAAEQILENPLDFYGGDVNWYGFNAPHYTTNKNPPLVSYLIAAVSSVFGFNEVPLHIFFFLPVAFSAIGIYLLGRQFSTDPLMATMLATLTPVFLVHSTNLMTDSTLLMFWTWGIVYWLKGISTHLTRWFLLAGIFVAFGILTKYTCLFLMPLILFSGIWTYRRPGNWLVSIFVPLAAMFSFDYYTRIMYGVGLLQEAFSYSSDVNTRSVVDYFESTLIGLSFLGGCFPVALLLSPLIWSRRLNLVMPILLLGVLSIALFLGKIGDQLFVSDGTIIVNSLIHFCVFSMAGILLVTFSLREISKGFQHDSVFLLLWFFGIFIFVCYLNWTINARSFILLVPVVGILMVRGIEERRSKVHSRINVGVWPMLGIAGMIAVATTFADYVWAGTARIAASDVMTKYNDKGKVWFKGHWGFQYYMEKLGALPIDYRDSIIQTGDFVVIPMNNSNSSRPDASFDWVDTMKFATNFPVHIMSPNDTAGFYSSIWGSVPYKFETSSKEIYRIYLKK